MMKNMKTIAMPWIKLRENPDQNDYGLINGLQEKCIRQDSIVLKLELDYKLGAASQSAEKTGIQSVNEFMYFDGQELIGYIGICGFGGIGSLLEVTGMVHPEYRYLGVFTKLHELVQAECKRRNSGRILLLCDKKSDSGQKFLKKTGAVYQYSEYEMFLQPGYPKPIEEQLCGIVFRKATNADALEIARQNAIYFNDRAPFEEPYSEQNDSDNAQRDELLLPEEEEKRGMLIWLAEKDGQVIGKAHLQVNSAVGGIYGLGVLPEYRGKGLGRAVLKGAVQKLQEAGFNSIMLQVAAENAIALSLYKSCGFVENSTMDYFELSL